MLHVRWRNSLNRPSINHQRQRAGSTHGKERIEFVTGGGKNNNTY